MSLLPRALFIVLLGVILGAAGNAISPRGIPWVTPPKKVMAPDEYLPLEKARELWESGEAMFLDARAREDFEAGHIGNALNLPANLFEQRFGEVAPMLSPESKLVLYCDGTECDLSHRLETSLRQLGYTNIFILFNGWTAWKQAGLPTGEGGAQ